MECHQKEVMASYSFGRFCRHFSENASKRKTFYFNLSHGCQTVEMKWFCGGNLEELHTDLFFLLLLWVLQRASTYSEICVVLQCLPDVWEEHVPLPRKENEATEFCLGWRFPDNHKALCYGSPGDVEGRWHCNHHLLCLSAPLLVLCFSFVVGRQVLIREVLCTLHSVCGPVLSDHVAASN